MRLIVLILLLFALPAWAVDTVQIDRDDVTTSVPFTPAGIGALKSADYKVKNVLTLGIKNDGTDQGTAIQSLITAAADGDTFYFPTGTYGTSVKLELPTDKSIRIIGDGRGRTAFKALATMTSVIHKGASATNVVLKPAFKDFDVLCDKKAGIGLDLEAYKSAELQNLWIEDYTGPSAVALGRDVAWAAKDAFYEGRIDNVTANLPLANWPDPATRPDYGILFRGTASDNMISKVVTPYAKTTGIYDKSYGSNKYTQLHPWSTPYGMIIEGSATVTASEFDTCTTAGVKIGAGGGVAITGNQFVNSTPTGVEITNGSQHVTISGNIYGGLYGGSATNKYTGTPGADFTFTDGVTFGTAAGNLVQLDGSAKVPLATLPVLAQAGLVTSLGSPGSDSNVPTEKAVRSAIAASSSGLSDPGANGIVKRTSINTTGVAAYGDVVALFGGGACSGYLKNDGSCGTSVGTVTSVNSQLPDGSGNVTVATANISDSTDKRYVTDAQRTVIGNTSGTNSGDETQATILSKLSTAFDAAVMQIKQGPTEAASVVKLKVTGTNGVDTATLTSAGVFTLIGNTSAGGFTLRTYSDTSATQRSVISLSRARGTTTPTVVQSGDELGTISFGGWDGAANQYGATIDGWADAAPTSGHLPTRLSFSTGTNSTDRTERLRIGSTGIMTEGLDDKTASFTIANSTSRITLATGTAVALLKKDLPAGTTSVLVTVAGAAASGVSFAAESGGSLSWGDAGTPSFTNSKTADVVCTSENAAATSTAAWRCVKGGNF